MEGEAIKSSPWERESPLGRPKTLESAHFVTAPLLVAAALSLAGVVAVAETWFRWSGPTLLLFVFTAVMLLASIQLSYYARQYLYSRADLADWCSEEYVQQHESDWSENGILARQQRDFKEWQKYSDWAVHCYNLGSVLLGLGISAALVPPDAARQADWRWTAAALVVAADLVEIIWISKLYFRAWSPRPRVTDESVDEGSFKSDA